MVSGEFMAGMFILFLVNLLNSINAMILAIAFKKHMLKCFKCFNGLTGCLSMVGFICFILLSCSRWSEAGRACAGEYMMDDGQNPAADGNNWSEFVA